MTMKLFPAAALIACTILSSCAASDNKDYIDKSVIPNEAERKAAGENQIIENNNPGTPVSPLNLAPQDNGQPISIADQAQQMTVTPVPTTQKTAPGMNPPHGEPGHRCDIAVGAPLNSSPVPATAANTIKTPVMLNTNLPVQQKTAPGMNPPHGEPGHRCDIAVGAPLNSMPAAPVVTPVTTTTPAALPSANKPDSSQ